MTLSAAMILTIAIVVVVLVLIGLWTYNTANRLDRLHVRSDLSWQALDAALARRAVVVRSIAATAPAAEGRRLAELADRAERADRLGREAAENELSGALAGLDVERLRPRLVAELADAEARVLIARRFHNDAVRDTLAQRIRRPVRWLHLGGTAPLPTYFEIAERAVPAAVAAPPSPERARTSARTVVLDADDRVLLLRGCDPSRPTARFWFTVGGEVETDEDLPRAAARELAEETGLQVSPDRLIGPVWRRSAVFPFNGEVLHSEELFFVVRVEPFTPAGLGFTELERSMRLEHRWFDSAELKELSVSGEPVYPRELPELLDEAIRFSVHVSGDPLPAIRRIS